LPAPVKALGALVLTVGAAVSTFAVAVAALDTFPTLSATVNE
jgi:hypothetical protein